MENFVIPRNYNKLELKFFYLILSKIKEDQPSWVLITSIELYSVCQQYRVKIDDMFFKMKSKDAASIIVEGKKMYINIFDSFEERQGYWIINFDQRFVNIFLNLKKIANEKIIVMFGLESVEAMKLYNAVLGHRSMYFDKLKIRALFNQSEGTNWARIENKILKPAIAEINKISDIQITMLDVKEKRYPIGFLFNIKQNKKTAKNY